MKITKKLAKEIFNGNFENVDFEALKAESDSKRARVNVFANIEDVKKHYNLPEYIIKKDFEGLKSIDIVYLPNEEYRGRNTKGHLMTDVLSLNKIEPRESKLYYVLGLYRYFSNEYEKETEFSFNKETRQEIIDRLVASQEIKF